MNQFKHRVIENEVCTKFNLKSYKLGNFTHFKNNKTEIGYIEKISNKHYMYTVLINFFDFENQLANDRIVNFIKNKYIDQKSKIDKQGFNVVLELRGNTINTSKLI